MDLQKQYGLNSVDMNLQKQIAQVLTIDTDAQL